ncbi:MAG: glycosyltransferase, partial [Deltaproteobacteria bacterium]|nr:glycosyltransferase [Deltaproteobacteria bacterium]
MELSIILPTYNENENVKKIIPKISQILKDEGITGEILVLDDDSVDGTAYVAQSLANEYPVKVHVRKNERGLATAVIKGFEL